VITAVTLLALVDEDQATAGFAGLGVGVGVATAAGVTLLDAADGAVCQVASLAFEVNV
jgi:hypothetical protein